MSRSKPRTPFRIKRLILKELRETLRDRRTVLTLILMPLLVYPALSLVFKTFLFSNLQIGLQDDPVKLQFVLTSDGTNDQTSKLAGRLHQTVRQIQQTNLDENGQNPLAAEIKFAFPNLADFHDHTWSVLPEEQADSLEELVEFSSSDPNQRADVGVRFLTPKDNSPFGYQVQLFRRNDMFSETAAQYLNAWLKRANQYEMQMRLKMAGVPSQATWLPETTVVGELEESSSPVPLASLIPLILVLMTITGAVYPAIDLTAGERERGTLETLMAAPIPRFGILFSKFVAVVTVAMLTAVLNLIGMFATVWAFQLDKQLGVGVFNLTTMFQILLLLVLFAAFFSAILLVVTSFAKSFKEAQVYLIPIILFSLAPGLLAMTPGMELKGFYTICPMINILLLARDVIQGSVQTVPAILAVVSTIVYGVGAIRLAAELFGSDAILYADSSSVREMLQRPRSNQRFVPLGASTLALLILVPLNFAAVHLLDRLPSETAADFTTRFLVMGSLLFIQFMVFPSLVAAYQKTNFKTGFGLTTPKPVFLLGAILLGASMWPIVMSMTSLWHDVYTWMAGAEAGNQWHDQLVEKTEQSVAAVRQVHPLVIAVCFSIIPAVCEEWFFRGMLQRSLLKHKTVLSSILLSGLVFGAFHMISSSVIAVDRFLPTTLMGIVLGYIAYKSNSIWPGIALHAIHNAFVIFLAYYQKQLADQPWFPADEEIPLTWVMTGVALASAGLTLIVFAQREPCEQ
jgi:membrane protease YdiL (CAAX protease family)/ABC-type Na+ efflux pump permease subunit